MYARVTNVHALAVIAHTFVAIFHTPAVIVHTLVAMLRSRAGVLHTLAVDFHARVTVLHARARDAHARVGDFRARVRDFCASLIAWRLRLRRERARGDFEGGERVGVRGVEGAYVVGQVLDEREAVGADAFDDGARQLVAAVVVVVRAVARRESLLRLLGAERFVEGLAHRDPLASFKIPPSPLATETKPPGN